MSAEQDLKLCPWCGGPADIEEIGGKDGAAASFSVGCHDGDGKAVCFGFQSLTAFARKAEAIAAWNRRPTPSPSMEGLGVPSGRDAPSDEHSRQMVVLPNGQRVELCSMFKLVFQEEFLTIAGPVKGYSGADRRAAQLMREAWNKLPVWPSIAGTVDEVEGQAEPSEDAPNSPSHLEAVEAARRIVAEAPCDEDLMRARANLCAFSGYDEDGIQQTYRAFIVARALLSSLSEGKGE